MPFAIEKVANFNHMGSVSRQLRKDSFGPETNYEIVWPCIAFVSHVAISN